MRFLAHLSSISFIALLSGCAPKPAPVSPADIAELSARAAREPGNGAVVLRYAAALQSGDQCDTALVVARRGMTLAPQDALGPLVAGRCLERADRYDEALAVYRTFLDGHPDARGSGAVRGRQLLAARAVATREARTALANEAALSSEPADPQTVAVLPLHITGDSSYRPLSRGLAQFLTSDLALLRRFRMVERMEVSALLDEIAFDQGARVEPQTAARVGRLIRAGRLVQGLAAIASERYVRLETSVLTSTGEVSAPAEINGRLRDLLTMEKQIVLALASRLGYTLSEAERRAVLENGTQNLAAFLAYSRALEAEDRGDYAAAAAYYQEAARRDPGFAAARQGYQAAVAAPQIQAAPPSAITVLATQPSPVPVATLAQPVATVIGATIGDLAATQAEQTASVTQTTQQAVKTTTAQPPPPTVVPPAGLIGTIRIVFKLP
jgi:tetratricopeptide (TPR) repeat protein